MAKGMQWNRARKELAGIRRGVIDVRSEGEYPDRTDRWIERNDSEAIRRRVIEGKRSNSGGWSKKQLAEWGVPWPPPKGWRACLEKNGFPYKP